jgi:Flp pilus assembly protein TadB
MSSILAAFIFALGVALVFFWFAPGPISEVFSRPIREKNLQERLQRNLRLAGVFDQAPTVIIFALLGAILAVAIVVGVVLSNFLLGIIIAVIAVPGAAHYMLMSRQRGYMNRAADDLAPFLNRIATATKSGKPVQSAYIEAVEEANELRRVLADSAAKMTAGMRFRDAIVETIPLLPFRMWSVFVRQLEAHDEGGGDISSAIEETVRQTNEVLMLHAEARSSYAAQARQQKLIVIVALGGVAFFAFVNGLALLSVLWTTAVGWVALALAAAVMGGGLWFSRKQLSDIEKKQAF